MKENPFLNNIEDFRDQSPEGKFPRKGEHHFSCSTAYLVLLNTNIIQLTIFS